MSRVRHCWPGTGAHLRLVHDVRDTKTEQARRGFDDAFDTRIEPWHMPHMNQPVVIPLDTSFRARLMRAVDRLLANFINLRSPL